MALRGIQEYVARDVNSIALIEDEGNVVSIEDNIFLYPPKRAIQYHYLSSHESESLWDVATVTKVGGA